MHAIHIHMSRVCNEVGRYRDRSEVMAEPRLQMCQGEPMPRVDAEVGNLAP